ncbi:hypothetical protein [Humibacter ginsenosidimutans]|uniref:hypothetical protein n=1 Tax=Humibacter ginsenosidimutans TaxID=2599293 RepID=UPI001FEFB2C6|nr:hypothetical protein [Humibacter ginsenosidimutans]
MTHITESLSERLTAVSRRVQRSLRSPARTKRMAVVLGRVLAFAFVVCFLTGLYSHLLQDPLPGMRFPTSPYWLYQATQGVHITVGLALFPLLLAKLWTVYPVLFRWPAITSWRDLVERGLIAALVSSALLEPVIGLINTFQWYPWPFSFRKVHYGLAWLIVGGIALHIAFKLPIIVRHWRRGDDDEEPV